jgi:hypothetical protein
VARRSMGSPKTFLWQVVREGPRKGAFLFFGSASATMRPPIAYHLGLFTDWAYPILASLPVLRSHYFGLLWRHLPTR